MDSFEKSKISVNNKKDRSRKGSIDTKIKRLCEILNSSENYYTTSSCSGRIIVIDRGFGRKKDAEWIFVSHEPADPEKIIEAIDKACLQDSQVWLKQEPFIIHVCAKHFEDAEDLLDTARRCGLKRAGIISLSGKIMIEIISNEAVETIIADKGRLIVSDSYLRKLVEVSNEKLKKNFCVLEKFEKSVEEMIRRQIR